VYALGETWGFLDRLIDVFRPSSWTDAFPIERHVLELGAVGRTFLHTDTLSMSCALGCHSVPTIGLRVDTRAGGALVYSSDTGPCSAVVDLARGCDVLIHESTFQTGDEEQALALGHSTARQAAETAAAAGAARLVLIHYTPQGPADLGRLGEGAAAFRGPIDVPSDLERLTVA
jgi:ribonuclease Z